ncbi:TRAP transporter permease [Halomarina litorea]|uniref:TRAP transporter permease n=1 Tax=Halomarina litorea TaxID=2961595 RepID=UPI0020C36709|nr:TRAP transporter fused permease subunit [Halomarina sp. BCD28]
MSTSTDVSEGLSGMDDVRAAVRGWFDRPRGELTLRGVIATLAIVLSAYTFYYANTLVFVRVRHSNIFLGLGMALFFLYEALKHRYGTDDVVAYRDRERAPQDSILARARTVGGSFDWVVTVVEAVLILGAAYYVETNFDRLLNDAVVIGYTDTDFLVGAVIVLLVADATRRAYGWAITSVVAAAIAYAMAGPWLPSFLGHTGMSWQEVARYGAIGLSGTYGFILGVGTTWVAIFIIFAGMAKTFGALDYILDAGQSVGKRMRSGVVQVAVVSSMAMGSITGSAAANTATTGSFTIPMMQRQGVRDDFAAAIESVASSGGQMMPPVMGVAAFIMADILQVGYVRIIQAAIIPALLFYFSVGIAVQFVVLRFGWTTERDRSGNSFAQTLFSRGTLFTIGYLLVAAAAFVVVRGFAGALVAGAAALAAMLAARFVQSLVTQSGTTAVREDFGGSVAGFFSGAHFAVPMAVLVYTLVVMRLTPLSAGLYTAATLVATIFVRRLVVDDSPLWGLVNATTGTVKGLRDGAVDMSPLVGVLAAMGIIISMLTQTGLAQKISIRMVGLAGGVLIAVLVMAMFLSILFGLGMPTPAAYILVVILVAPGIIDVGVPEIIAHLFVFYFAMLSAITPPVAVAVAVGSRIANANFMQTGFQALRIGAPGFLIPFALVANPSLVYWELPATPIYTVIVFVGVVALVTATTAYDGTHELGWGHRIAYFTLSVAALYAPMLVVQAAAALLAVAGLALAQMGRLPLSGTSENVGR